MPELTPGRRSALHCARALLTLCVTCTSLEVIPATYLYGDGDGYHFMDQNSYETITLRADVIGDDRQLLADNVTIQLQKFNGRPIGLQFPPHVELSVRSTEPGRIRQ